MNFAPVPISPQPIWSRLKSIFTAIPWRLWLCFPMSIRSAVYHRLENWYADGEWNIWHLPFGLILKHTHDRSPFLEASNIAFVRKNTSIPVPHILDVIPSLPSYPGGLIIMKNIEGMTLHGWLRTRISYPPEFYHYLNILENGEDINIDELRAILDGFEPTADLSDSVALLDDLRRAPLKLRAIPPPPSGQVSGAYGAPFISMLLPTVSPFSHSKAFVLSMTCSFNHVVSVAVCLVC
ncbi:uncharacterized protein EV420DRAFT_424991 [Desarmillaria tabescens]|uniref:Uncharacterized protein n=1 Tax=Armillaria tabescens TaxID=1929756 RepID=A0AA39TR90_ARMTA|nr:uncharacterized protein EV420DRAFT_424991 [Desarmillaria tabescens]KAK0467712.1 hypothetical protein EV420DRAFT_424991 [Desarmillaria tabescens]